MPWAKAITARSGCRWRFSGRSTHSDPRRSARAIIPTIISQATPPGPEVKLGHLDPAARDLTYVKDTVAGFIAIAGCEAAAAGRVVNIGRSEDISIKQGNSSS